MRVALGERGDAVDEVVGRLGAGAVGDEAAQVGGVQAAEVHVAPEAAELAEDTVDLRPARRGGGGGGRAPQHPGGSGPRGGPASWCVVTTSTGESPIARARNASSSSDGRSAVWRSSISTTTGAS